MSIRKQTCFGGVVMVVIISTALALGQGVHYAGSSAEEDALAGTTGPPAGKAPPLPKAGPLAKPRSLQQVGLPVELTRSVTPADNPQTPEKIALGQKLFFEGRLSADGSVACATATIPPARLPMAAPPRLASTAAPASGTPRPF